MGIRRARKGKSEAASCEFVFGQPIFWKAVGYWLLAVGLCTYSLLASVILDEDFFHRQDAKTRGMVEAYDLQLTTYDL